MNTAATLAAAIFGAAVGSFLNVCIYRLPLGKSVVWPGSACARCGRSLSWFENIPIVSYLALWGRCRSCRAAISGRYPVVEALTALMFAAGWWYYGPGVLLVSRLVFGCALIVLFAFEANDLRRAALERRGFKQMGTAIGRDRDAAELAFFRSWLPQQKMGRRTIAADRVVDRPGSAGIPAPKASGEAEGVIGLFPAP